MKRAGVNLTVLALILAIAACADSTAPSPSPDKAAPAGVRATRYILASGDVPPAGCRDLGNGYWLCDDTEPSLAAPATTASPDSSGDNQDYNN